jgi:hypothetical protein
MIGAVIAGQLLFVHGAIGMETKEGVYIAGLKPDQRPEDAPLITEASKDHAWYAKALTGISQPFPNSLRFLDDQGNWYTPFNRPGMTGRYDIRGWHQQTK